MHPAGFDADMKSGFGVRLETAFVANAGEKKDLCTAPSNRNVVS